MTQEKRAALFQGWDGPMVRACLQGHMGQILTWGEESGMAVIGDFCFLAGRPAPELVERADAPILVPQDSAWEETVRAVLGERAAPFTRYATQHRPEGFERGRLSAFAAAVPKGAKAEPVDQELYLILMEEAWSQDLCSNFQDSADFMARGLGVVISWEGRPVAGASSYAVCGDGIEIEIDTAPAFRRRGLATACGAQLILDCLDRGLYPNWDAHDRRSLALAEKLGYQLERPYTAYWVEEKVRDKRRPHIFAEKAQNDT